MPEIQFGLLQGWQNLPQDRGKEMQGWQKHARDSVETFAGVAKPSPRFSSVFYEVEME